MSDYYGYDLNCDRDRNRLILDIFMGIVTVKEAVYLLQGHPCEDDFFVLCHQLRDLDPPDDEACSST